MTTMPNYRTPDDVAFARAASASASHEDVGITNPEVVIASAQGIYDQAREQSRLLSAVCFLAAAGLAVWMPGGSAGFMVSFLALAVLVSASSKPLAMRQFRLTIEQTARAQGLSPTEASRAAAKVAATWRAARSG